MNALDSADIDRRRFLAVCASSACGLTLATTGCASLATHSVTPVNGAIRLAFADHPQLTQPQGMLRVLPTGEANPIFVLALGDGQFSALSSVCTHRGCAVDAHGDRLVCPCHGSTYDRSGAVLRGPAERPLRRYAVQVDGDHITIMLGSA